VTPDDRIERAANALAEAADGPVRVILFGSQARGDSNAASDVDFLVVQRDVGDRFEESVRLAQVVADLRVPADVVVVSEDQVEEWGAVPGTMIHDALAEGRVLAEA
jgi:predicted nucleotidyltransferase